MKFSRFLRSESIPLCFLALGLFIWNIFAICAGVLWIVTVITDAVAVACAAAWLAFSYLAVRRRLQRLRRLAEEVEEGYLLAELLPRPANAVEEEYYRAMKFVSRSAVGAVKSALRAQEEYRDYVERWIHEIKTPLTACSLILANGSDARKIKTELIRIENLTESVLYCARLRTAENDTQIAAADVRAAVSEAVKSEMPLLMAANIGVEAEGGFTACTDAKAVTFIVKQLLVNCSKYCPNCRVTITLAGRTVTVEDDGPGIAPHELPRIFARGFVGSAGRKHGGGTGMGLYLVREVCQKLGLGIEAQSKEGEYTRFILTFPA